MIWKLPQLHSGSRSLINLMESWSWFMTAFLMLLRALKCLYIQECPNPSQFQLLWGEVVYFVGWWFRVGTGWDAKVQGIPLRTSHGNTETWEKGQECGAASELKEEPGSGLGCGGWERLWDKPGCSQGGVFLAGRKAGSHYTVPIVMGNNRVLSFIFFPQYSKSSALSNAFVMSSGCVLTKSSLLSWVLLSEGGSVDFMMPMGGFWFCFVFTADGGRKWGEADRGGDRVPAADSHQHPARGSRGAAQGLSNGHRRQRWPGIAGSTSRGDPAAVSLALIPVQSCTGHNCKIYSFFYDLEVMREAIVLKQAGNRTPLFGGFVINRGGSARVCSGAAWGMLGAQHLWGFFHSPQREFLSEILELPKWLPEQCKANFGAVYRGVQDLLARHSQILASWNGEDLWEGNSRMSDSPF